MILEFKKILKQFSFLVCFCACMFEVEQCIEKLVRDSTATHIYFEEFGNHGVPSITVCAFSDHMGHGRAYKTDKLEKHGLTIKKYVRDHVWWSNIPGITPEEVYEDVTWNLDDLVDSIEYTFADTKHWLSPANKTWLDLWSVTNKKWEGRCFTFNPTIEMSRKGLININIISKFSSDLEIRFHAAHQATDKELDGVMFRVRYRQHYILEVPVDVIINRNTEDSMPCTQGSHHFDEARRTMIIKKMVSEVGCVVPYIIRNSSDEFICRDEDSAKIADLINEGKGKYYNLFNWKTLPLPCQQFHVEPRNAFEAPDWNNLTFISANFMKTSKVVEQLPAYSLLSFYAELGGGVALLLGISVHQLVVSFIDTLPGRHASRGHL